MSSDTAVNADEETFMKGYVLDISPYLTMALMGEDIGDGEICLLGQTRYNAIRVNSNGIVIVRDVDSVSYPTEGRRSFLEDSMNTGKFLGFIPASPDARDDIDDLKMEPYLTIGKNAMYI